jgi:hypothetical protein
MAPKRPVELVYIPRLWPAFAESSAAALMFWGLAVVIGHRKAFLIFAAIAFCTGILAFALSLRRRVGIIPLSLPSNELRFTLLKLSIGLCWGTLLFLFLWLR